MYSGRKRVVHGIALVDILLSLIPVLYFPVTNSTERLSDDARHALQNYIRTGGFIAIDVVSGGRVNNSEPLRNLLDDLQIRPPQRLEEGHTLTQSFYLLSSQLNGGH